MADVAYEQQILDQFFATWRIVQHDIATMMVSTAPVSLHSQLVERWFQYLDHVDSTVGRAKVQQQRGALDNAHAVAIGKARAVGSTAPPMDVSIRDRNNESEVGAHLSPLPHTVTASLMRAVNSYQHMVGRRTSHAVAFHRLIANASLPMLGRAMVGARTEIERTGRDAVRDWLRAHPDKFRGWVWKSSLSLDDCPCCWAMHNSGHDLRDNLNDHPNGNCKIEPWYHGEDLPVDGEQMFAQLTVHEQEKVLGTTRSALYRNGQVTLQAMVAVDKDPTWGEAITPVPIRMLDKAQAGR